MLTTMTVGTVLTPAGQVVGEFGGLIGIVAGLALGIFGVRFLIKQVRKSR